MSVIAGLLRRLTLAFGAGMFGVVILFLAGRGLGAIGLPKLLGLVPRDPPPFPAGAYGPLVWGGIYGLLLALPLLNRWWLLKGAIIGLAPVIGLLVYFDTALRAAPPGRIAYTVLIHVIWGIGAALWFRLVARSGEASAQRFSAYR